MTSVDEPPVEKLADLSVFDRLVDLSPAARASLIEEQAREYGVGESEMKRLLLSRWRFNARPAQLPPPGDWRTWYLRGGRGSGKSRTGAETLKTWIVENPPGDWAIIAPTFGDARDVCVESGSGILRALGGEVLHWNRSIGEIITQNGSKIFIDGANDGALRIQGKNLRAVWCDEVGLWERHNWQTAWEESIQFAVRLAPGRIVATGTPKAGHPLIKLLLDDPSTVVTRMRTIDNAENLHPAALEELRKKYEGKRLGRQELDAEFLEDVEGALWTRDMIEAVRIRPGSEPPTRRIVVGVDPNASASEAANSAGIIVAALGSDGLGYVLDDRTVDRGGPRAWAVAVRDAYHDWEADLIVAEKNNGGEMVRITVEAADPSVRVPIQLVTASKGKRTRAEPISLLYQGAPGWQTDPHINQPQVRHVGTFPELEDQLTTWTPEAESPDRMDALVWALTELLVGAASGEYVSSVARGTISTNVLERRAATDQDVLGRRY